MPSWTTMNDLSTGDLVTEADMDAIRGNIEYLLDPNPQRLLRDNGGNYSTTSTAFVDVDGTNLAATITTHGGPVLVLASGVYYGSASIVISLDIAVDGTRLGSSFAEGLYRKAVSTGADAFTLAALVTGLSAGAHTFKLQWKVNTGTGYLQSAAAQTPVQLTVIEL